MIRSLWDSVYQNMFGQAVKSSPYNPTATLKKGVPLNIDLPPLGPIEMHTCGVQFIDYVLVKVIIAIGGFQHPSNEILFWHPSKKRREWSSVDKTIRMIPGSKNTDFVLNDQSDNAKEDSNQDILETSPTIMRFANYPVVETRRSSVGIRIQEMKSSFRLDVVENTQLLLRKSVYRIPWLAEIPLLSTFRHLKRVRPLKQLA
ncbi:hypothetical protein K0T92_16290 [Paenibacillus oenotherae]|uniref:Uncharacterized protein n=1 Tax=Paenibacillus oenotherae TaxID=1435645 RepID=A0ABS7D955_9BACL|nr:hypothetical protein [Paenibacillus oenotherae]MBW7476293.1 hypothetical protein [Paenibacillus oenotherae]